MDRGNDSPPTPPIVYQRSDSEVVEKPGFHGVEGYELMAFLDDEDNTYSDHELEVRVVESSQSVPCYSPHSQCSTSSSSKGDIDGPGDEWGGQGDVDEGFDEEFCDTEDKDNMPPLHTIDEFLSEDNVNLNNSLDAVAGMSMPNTSLFDDFDLSVDDVLDSELQQSEPLKSPMVPVPSSPYQLVTTSPAAVTTADMQLMSINDRNEYLSQNQSASPSSSVHSHHSMIQENDDLAALLSVSDAMSCVSDYNPPITATGFQPFSCNSSYPNATYTHAQSTVSASSYNPTLTSVNLSLNDPLHLMDLTEASKLVTSEADSVMLDTCYGLSHNSTSAVHLMTSTSTTIANSSPAAVYMENPNTPNISQTEGIDTYSRGSQTQGTNGTPHNEVRRSLSPAPSHPQPNYPPVSPSYSGGACYYPNPTSPHSPASSYASLSPGPSSDVETALSPKDQKLVDIPFHQFKKILDDPSIPEKEKEHIKNIRRRGKNKVAAKNCRKKKLSVLCGLQQEVDKLKLAINRHGQKSRSLEQEIAFYKQRCSRTHGPIGLSRKHS